MSLLQEATLDRLWNRYQNRFGHQPPIQSASLDQAIVLLRRDLMVRPSGDGDDDDGGPRSGGLAAGKPAAFPTWHQSESALVGGRKLPAH